MINVMLDNINESKLLKQSLQQIITNENLLAERNSINIIAAELGVDHLTCASALLYLLQKGESITPAVQKIDIAVLPPVTNQLNIKMVRYRLDIGSKHQLTLDTLKQVLVEESGVDKNNINNVNIQDLYTLVNLPDEMPLDIFQHLKTVEINQQKLDIKRVKARNNKKRGNNHYRRGRQANTKSGNKMPDNIISN